MKRKALLILLFIVLFGIIGCSKEEFSISYNLDGGTCDSLVKIYQEGETITLPTPTKEGYIFVGWFEENEKVEVITEGNHKLVARWELENNDKNPDDGKDPNDSKDPLKEAKEKNKDALEKFVEDYFERDEYSDNGWQSLQDELKKGLEEIEKATTTKEADDALTAAKRACNAVLTIYDEEEIALQDAIEKALKELEEIKASLVEEEFNSTDFVKINYFIEETRDLIYDFDSIDQIDESMNKIKEAIENAERIYKIVYENISNDDCNYTYFGYKSYDEVVNEFAADYKTYTGLALSKWNGSSVDTLKVFTESNDKWWWLLDYWASVNKCSYNGLSSAKVFEMLKSSKQASAVAADYYYCISTEAEAFVNKTKSSVYAGDMYSADYSNEEVREKVLGYMLPKQTYTTGDTYDFPTPTREFQDFLGWYLTSDFSGEVVTGITASSKGTITVYAKWSELSEEDQFKLDIRVAQLELKNYIKEFKKEDYSATAWANIETTLNEGLNNLTQATKETLSTMLAKEKAKLDAISPTRFAITYKLNGGNWNYTSYDEIIKDFIKDYSAFKGTVVNGESFFEVSYTSSTTDKSIDTFFRENVKWQWMIDYFKDICPEDKKENYDLDTVLFAQLRTQIQAFLLKTKRINAGYESDDFSDTNLTKNVLSYVVNEKFEYLEEVSDLPVPLKSGYTFKGWYSDEGLQTVVTKASKNITLYAKWEETTDEEYLAIAILEKKNELTKYYQSINKEKYSTSVWELKTKTYEDGLKAFETAESIANLEQLYVESVAAIDSFKQTDYIVTFKLDGGHWLYSTHEEIVAAFLADYNAFRGRTDITQVGFFDMSWTSDTTKDIKAFFVANPQWNWILDYITSVVGEDQAAKFDVATMDVPQTRVELEGIFNKAAIVNSSTNYASKDYSVEETINKIFDFISYEEIEYVDVVTELPTPIKVGYTFKGWFSEVDLVNEVTQVTEPIILYAKWEANE